ncbi:MAG: glucose-1-phosphate adenylyltransferase [Deltaproteobacteria bacterium]|nr:glucose-1-phosphate adenylyltransferase [Deltaproteobacteria bacterium]
MPFGGPFRIIDFTMTNLMQSGIHHVGVLTQYRPTSLMEHLGDGESWDMSGFASRLTVLPPQLGSSNSDWYRGTADAVFRNLRFLDNMRPDHVLVLSGDHIYHMRYDHMLDRHLASRADLTVASIEVPWEDTVRFGVMVTAGQGEVTRFVEKSPDRVSNLANMGVYLFRYEALVEEVRTHCSQGAYDFGADVIPAMLGRRGVYAHRYHGYWRDVGTLDSYWSANMDALDPSTGLDLREWRVRTNLEGRGQVYHPPVTLGDDAGVTNSLVSRGCRVLGTVRNSVLSPGVKVGAGAVVVDSVIMHDCVIEAGAEVRRAILDKDVVVGEGARIGKHGAVDGANIRFPSHLSGGISVVGKGTRIPAGRSLGANVLVGTGLGPDSFPSDVADGECV